MFRKKFFYFSFVLIYLKWFHGIDIKYSSISFSGVENLNINHCSFHLHIKSISFSSSFPIFIWQRSSVSIGNIHLKINSTKNKVKTKRKLNKNAWIKKLYLLQVRFIFINKLVK